MRNHEEALMIPNISKKSKDDLDLRGTCMHIYGAREGLMMANNLRLMVGFIKSISHKAASSHDRKI